MSGTAKSKERRQAMNFNENMNNNGDEDRLFPEGVAEETKWADSEIEPFANQVEGWEDKAHG